MRKAPREDGYFTVQTPFLLGEKFPIFVLQGYGERRFHPLFATTNHRNAYRAQARKSRGAQSLDEHDGTFHSSQNAFASPKCWSVPPSSHSSWFHIDGCATLSAGSGGAHHFGHQTRTGQNTRVQVRKSCRHFKIKTHILRVFAHVRPSSRQRSTMKSRLDGDEERVIHLSCSTVQFTIIIFYYACVHRL